MANAKTKTTAENAADTESVRNEQLLKRSHEMVGTIVHFYNTTPAIESQKDDDKAQAEIDRRAAAPLAAVITSFQPQTDVTDETGDEFININVFAPTGGSHPAFGVLLVSGVKALKDDDSRAFCYPV